MELKKNSSRLRTFLILFISALKVVLLGFPTASGSSILTPMLNPGCGWLDPDGPQSIGWPQISNFMVTVLKTLL